MMKQSSRSRAIWGALRLRGRGAAGRLLEGVYGYEDGSGPDDSVV